MRQLSLILLVTTLASADPAPQSSALPGVRSLTGVRDSYPHLSPDGRQLLFHSNRTGRQAIWLANADGTNPRILFDDPATGANPGTPDWSPDGAHIAFAMRPAGAADTETEIYVMRADGTDLRRLTRSPGNDGQPHWSRSRRIYFNSARATPDPAAPPGEQRLDIYSMNEDGADIRRHTHCAVSCTFPVPSPDERFIVHRSALSTEGVDWNGAAAPDSEIFVTPLDGGAGVNVSNSRGYDGWPAWSPDGRWIVFASNRDHGAFHAQIYAVRPDGTGLQKLTSGAWSRIQPSFNPAGDRILVNEHIESRDFEVSHLTSFEFLVRTRNSQ